MAAAALTFAVGCAAVQPARRLEVPGPGRLYVAVFVDETEAGEIGVLLAQAIRVEVYRRDPALLALVFDEGSLALDGTVVSLEEEPASVGAMQVRIRAEAALVDWDGEVVADLGTVEATASYFLRRDRQRTEAGRRQAVEEAVRALAREIVRRVDRAARGDG